MWAQQLVGLMFLPAIGGLLPAPWGGRVGRFTLLEAAQQETAPHPAASLFSPALSPLVLLAWPAATRDPSAWNRISPYGMRKPPA